MDLTVLYFLNAHPALGRSDNRNRSCSSIQQKRNIKLPSQKCLFNKENLVDFAT